MRSKEAIKRAQKKYEASGAIANVTKSYRLKCHKMYDADIIEKLDEAGNKNGYIKTLIRNDIKKQG